MRIAEEYEIGPPLQIRIRHDGAVLRSQCEGAADGGDALPAAPADVAESESSDKREADREAEQDQYELAGGFCHAPAYQTRRAIPIHEALIDARSQGGMRKSVSTFSPASARNY